MTSSTTNRIFSLIEANGPMRLRELIRQGIHPEAIRRLREVGRLMQVSRGTYALTASDAGEHQTLVEACRAIPNGVICLLSALRFHEITTQAPFEIWMAVHAHARKPVADEVSIRIFWMSGAAFSTGIEEHVVAGTKVRVFNIAKTVADCFKFRNKIGLDVALEALRECWRERRCTMDDLWHYARICRVANVMRPYLESLE
jgi:predicted transcriptional regulator of viral defense system